MTNQNEVIKDLYTALKELSLTDLEIGLYTISLSLGPSPIKTIAEHMNISRPNVYKVIEGLEKHGLAQFSSRKKYTRDFSVEAPTKVLELLRKKKEKQSNIEFELMSAMPDLLAQYQQSDRPTKIKAYSTPEEFLKIFHQILDEAKDEICFFGSAQDFLGFISWDEEKKWIKKRTKKGLFIKSLLLPSEDTDTVRARGDKKELRETRIFHSPAPFVTSFQLFANKAIIWQPKATLAILIEDEYIVTMLKIIFDKLWEISK
ncbi:MAG: helix-turn-helix domain-containing protein [Candidatus Pacebacteria bacterium]|nr:helix-turn-helix domain-containing protein [Candidatus Paceibacterota bacterium]